MTGLSVLVVLEVEIDVGRVLFTGINVIYKNLLSFVQSTIKRRGVFLRTDSFVDE